MEWYSATDQPDQKDLQPRIKKGPFRGRFIMWLGNQDYSVQPCTSPCRFAPLILVRSCERVEPEHASNTYPFSHNKKAPFGAVLLCGWGTRIRT